MPAIRNPELFFCSVFIVSSQTKGLIEVCFSKPSVWGISIAVFKSLTPLTPWKYLGAVLASSFLNYIMDTFINNATHSVNDLRLLPIVIPTKEQKERVEKLVDRAIEIQKKRYATREETEKKNLLEKLKAVQREIDKEVETIYGVDMSLEGRK